jgi:hypothetical protein
MVSILDILSGALPLMVDVRQTGGSPVPADQVAEGDRLFVSHGKWMETSHPRSGELALLSYNVSKGAELSNPPDPGSEPTGNTVDVLDEIYESEAGVTNHWKLSSESWADFEAVLSPLVPLEGRAYPVVGASTTPQGESALLLQTCQSPEGLRTNQQTFLCGHCRGHVDVKHVAPLELELHDGSDVLRAEDGHHLHVV